jgi:adenylate kinase
MINLVLLGAPGSGKGTQAAMMAKAFEIPAISTGDALRKEVEAQSEIGKLAKSYMNSGQLVPDQVVLDIVKNRVGQKDCQKGFILDGFPRNLNQAEKLDETLKTIGKKISLVLDFKVDDEIVVKRISGRFFCKKCSAIYNHHFKQPKKAGVCDECGSTEFDSRSDDKEETVRNRLKIYHDSTAGLVEYYQKNNLIYSLDAVKNSALLFEEIRSVIKNIN